MNKEDKHINDTDKPIIPIPCPVCNKPMILYQTITGGIYWICTLCGCKVDKQDIKE